MFQSMLSRFKVDVKKNWHANVRPILDRTLIASIVILCIGERIVLRNFIWSAPRYSHRKLTKVKKLGGIRTTCHDLQMRSGCLQYSKDKPEDLCVNEVERREEIKAYE